MTKTFDELCASVLGEGFGVVPTQKPQQPDQQTANTTNTTTQQPSQPQQNAQPDAEVENAFKTLMAKAGQNPEQLKAIQALQQLLAQQQQNAANKPA